MCPVSRPRARSPSAQRLSASQRWAYLPGLRIGGAPGKCSTPFGITEVGISPDKETRLSWLECSTPFGITEVGMAAGLEGRALEK